MTKNKLFTSTLTISAAFLLAACGNGGAEEGAESGEEEAATEETNGDEASSETSTLTIGASNTPHAEILEFVQPSLEEQDVELDIVTYDDYVIPNIALDEGDIDANYFQHVPFFEDAVAENDYDFVNAGAVHLEPIGAYSQDYDSLEELPEGATILVSNNAPDHGRVLSIFEEAGLIEIEEGVDTTTATFDDIAENPNDFEFDSEYDPALMPTLYEQGEGDAVFVNSNFAVDYDIDVLEENIALESESSPYGNIIAIRSEDEGSEAIDLLMEELRSEETADFILETWGGAVVPVSEDAEDSETEDTEETETDAESTSEESSDSEE